MQPKDRKDLTKNIKDVVFASVSGSDVRRKLGRSIASSVGGPTVRKWDTPLEHQFSSDSRSRAHHVLPKAP